MKLWSKFQELGSESSDKLSEYAMKNIAEFIAEAYAEYLNNSEPREFAKAIGEIIEKKVKS